jgi:Fe-S-cluster containining protein
VKKTDLPAGLRAADRRLLAVVDGALAEAARRSSGRLACRGGCTDCCIGPFPITALDAARLRDGLSALESRDAEAAARVRARARASREVLASDFPGDPETGTLADRDDDEPRRERFFARHGALPCPALDPASGLCELYVHRPLSCRTFGPPMRIEGTDLPPCELCFVDSPPSEVEAARTRLDTHELEAPLVEELERKSGPRGETLVAFALGRP